MYEWEGESLEVASGICAERDPRHFRTALLTQGPGIPPPQALQWFRSRSELAHYLWRIEPQRWRFEAASLIRFKDKTQDLVAALEVVGLVDSLREAFNSIAADAFQIMWWGTFEDVKSAAQPWPTAVRQAFRSDTGRAGGGDPLRDDDASALIDFLQARYTPPYCPRPER